jgi:hypothetical protein
MSDGELDLMLITGAGASHPFGAPLMTEWCQELVKKLAVVSGYKQVTRLEVGLGPEDFEARLGEFLYRVQAFGEIEPLLDPSLQLQPPSNPMLTPGVLAEWHRTTLHHLRQVVGKIRESLYELFAENSLTVVGAAAAYRELFDALGIDVTSSRWMYTTTNYDVLGESVIADLGGRPDWGELPDVANAGTVRLDVDHLIDSIPRSTPVLHLHGRVGWYRRPDGSVYASRTTKHSEGYGVPIVMLPDLNKVYGEDLVISSLWSQFNDALSHAKRVLVLGHSLHDEALISALNANAAPARVMVSVLAHEDDSQEVDPSAQSVLQKIEEHGWHYVPLRFGQDLGPARKRLVDWTAELSS